MGVEVLEEEAVVQVGVAVLAAEALVRVGVSLLLEEEKGRGGGGVCGGPETQKKFRTLVNG